MSQGWRGPDRHILRVFPHHREVAGRTGSGYLHGGEIREDHENAIHQLHGGYRTKTYITYSAEMAKDTCNS